MRKVIVLAMAASAWAVSAAAQEPDRPFRDTPAPAVEFSIGNLGFPDDGGMVNEVLTGGSARFYLSPRVAIGPEFSYVRGENHHHIILTGNITFDFIAPSSGRAPVLTPFIVAGGGIYTTNESFAGRGAASPAPNRTSEGAFTAGGGVRSSLGPRLTLGAEARLGWELHLRVNAMFGYRF